MNEIKIIPLAEYEAQYPTWPEPDMRYLRSELPEPPALPLRDVFSPKWAEWIEAAAEAKAAPGLCGGGCALSLRFRAW